MIKIIKHNENLPLSTNKSFDNFVLNTNLKKFNLNKKILSFVKIQEMLSFFAPTTYVQVLQVPEMVYSDILTDIAALRMYDSTYKNDFHIETSLKHAYGKIIIIPSSKLTDKAYLFEVNGIDLLEEKTTIITEDLHYESYKDLSKIPLTFKNVFLIEGITSTF